MTTKKPDIEDVLRQKLSDESLALQIDIPDWSSFEQYRTVRMRRTNLRRVIWVATSAVAAVLVLLVTLPIFDDIEKTDSAVLATVNIIKDAGKQNADTTSSSQAIVANTLTPTAFALSNNTTITPSNPNESNGSRIDIQVARKGLASSGENINLAHAIISANRDTLSSGTDVSQDISTKPLMASVSDNTSTSHDSPPTTQVKGEVAIQQSVDMIENTTQSLKTTPRQYTQTVNQYDYHPVIRRGINRDKILTAYFNTATTGSSTSREAMYVPGGKPMLQAKVESLGGQIEHIDFDPTTLEHKTPISFGVTFGMEIFRRFRLESGLMYSYLESRAEQTSEYIARYDQRMSYLGVPLAATYSFYSAKVIDLYATAGVVAQFAVSAKGSTSVYRNDQLLSSSTARIPSGGVLWSVNAGVGINANLNNNIGFYFEPGVSRSFHNPNHPTSYINNNLLQLSLRVGVRITIP